ncbi:MAG: hypothetical protein D3M94_19120 [Rhodocyclales bacterium GT-UBC]|nr:MAG: hypothetical protein D3M94_19120 [Rhodocyclales bacterium GT-UBC]
MRKTLPETQPLASITVSSLIRSRRFYNDLLQRSADAQNRRERTLSYHLPEQQLEIRQETGQATHCSLLITVDDIFFHYQLVQQVSPNTAGIIEVLDDERLLLRLTDPDGNILELISRESPTSGMGKK